MFFNPVMYFLIKKRRFYTLECCINKYLAELPELNKRVLNNEKAFVYFLKKHWKNKRLANFW